MRRILAGVEFQHVVSGGSWRVRRTTGFNPWQGGRCHVRSRNFSRWILQGFTIVYIDSTWWYPLGVARIGWRFSVSFTLHPLGINRPTILLTWANINLTTQPSKIDDPSFNWEWNVPWLHLVGHFRLRYLYVVTVMMIASHFRGRSEIFQGWPNPWCNMRSLRIAITFRDTRRHTLRNHLQAERLWITHFDQDA